MTGVKTNGCNSLAWGPLHTARGEKNDSNVPLGSGDYLNGIPPSAAREGTWSRTVPQAPPQRLLDGTGRLTSHRLLHRGQAAAVRPLKTSSPQEQRTPELRGCTGSLLSLKCLQDGDLARSGRAQPARALLPGSEGKELPRRLPWAPREAATGAWFLRGAGPGWAGNALRPPITLGRARADGCADFAILA